MSAKSKDKKKIDIPRKTKIKRINNASFFITFALQTPKSF